MRISVGEFRITEEEKQAICDVLNSGRISEGSKTNEFEKMFAKFVGVKYAIATNSGTSALIAGLIALEHCNLNVKPKTKIITTPLTYIATSNAIILSGFEPVYVDVDRETFVITPENIRSHLEGVETIEYSVILPVHLMGYPCDMDPINKIAKEHGFVAFEDSAQAHGTMYKGRRTGSMSKLSGFSFYIAHNIQAGELGAITTNDLEIIRLIRKIKANGRICDCSICLRNEGKCPRLFSYVGENDFDPRFTHEIIGYNFKAMEFQTALALVQLKKVDRNIRKRQENVKYIDDGLTAFTDILQLPKYDNGVSYMAYPIVINKPEYISRKKIRIELEKRGIETRPLFSSIPTQQPAYSKYKEKYKGKLPNAEYIGLNGFYIGCHQYLSQEDLDYIINTFREVLK